MKKSFKAIQLGIVFMIVLSSVFAIVNVASEEPSTASAQIIPQLPVILDVYREDNETLAVDPDNSGETTIVVKYDLEGPIDAIENFYMPPTTVTLSIQGDEEDWIIVSLDRNQLEMRNGGEQKVKLNLAVTEEAPYIQQKQIVLTATAEGKKLWEEKTVALTIDYKPNFLYFVSATSKKSLFETNPQEPISIPITAINRATYNVKFDFRLVGEAPEGWSITPPNSIDVDSAQRGENEQEIVLSVTPPYDFGYHDEIQSFSIEVYAKPFPAGEGYQLVETLNFEVQSRGFSFSPSGYGLLVMILPIIIILILIAVILFTRYKRK